MLIAVKSPVSLQPSAIDTLRHISRWVWWIRYPLTKFLRSLVQKILAISNPISPGFCSPPAFEYVILSCTLPSISLLPFSPYSIEFVVTADMRSIEDVSGDEECLMREDQNYLSFSETPSLMIYLMMIVIRPCEDTQYQKALPLMWADHCDIWSM